MSMIQLTDAGNSSFAEMSITIMIMEAHNSTAVRTPLGRAVRIALLIVIAVPVLQLAGAQPLSHVSAVHGDSVRFRITPAAQWRYAVLVDSIEPDTFVVQQCVTCAPERIPLHSVATLEVLRASSASPAYTRYTLMGALVGAGLGLTASIIHDSRCRPVSDDPQMGSGGTRCVQGGTFVGYTAIGALVGAVIGRPLAPAPRPSASIWERVL
jgi:hypothetical protein